MSWIQGLFRWLRVHVKRIGTTFVRCVDGYRDFMTKEPPKDNT